MTGAPDGVVPILARDADGNEHQLAVRAVPTMGTALVSVGDATMVRIMTAQHALTLASELLRLVITIRNVAAGGRPPPDPGPLSATF